MKRRLFLFVIILLLASTACGSGGDDHPTRIPLETVPGTVTPDESPRIGPDADLPPTWTPAATAPAATPQLAGEEDPVPTGDEETYTVQAGDTLAEIAAAYGVTLDALVAANNIENIDVIEVGDVLVIPR
jgi:nucleoid-associated protein YgaU